MGTPRPHPEVLLRRYWEEPDTPFVTAGLSLLSVGYRVALGIRETAYGCRLLRTGRLPCPVVSIGNITLGGSGKTPMVELAVLGLRQLGAQPAVVTRGYGRKTRGVHVVSDRDRIQLGARAAGDEPVLLAEHLPGTPVVVGENRFEAGQVAIERCGATVLVLDDGFQHRSIGKDLEIVVVNGRAPWGQGHLFPRGMLREPLAGLGRADLIVITNPPTGGEVDAATATIRRHNKHAPVLVAGFEMIDAQEMTSGRRVSPGELAGRKLLAFAGLGSPRSFVDTLEGAGIALTDMIEFPDHHWFTPSELPELSRQARQSGAEGLITTEKDWMRLRDQPPPSVPLWVLMVRLRLDSGQEAWLRALEGVLSAAGR